MSVFICSKDSFGIIRFDSIHGCLKKMYIPSNNSNFKMNTIELKSDLHKILDSIENEDLLRTLYDFLKLRVSGKEGQIWEELSEEQKEEVYLSYKESREDSNLITWKSVKNKF